MSAQFNLKQLSLLFIFIFFVFGVSITGTVASGDELGRVNLLHFIALFVLWPFISFLLLIVFQFLPNQRSFPVIKTIINLSIWPDDIKNQLMELKRGQRFNTWLFLQSQLSMLAFSVGCLVSFLIVLLLSDVAFVWRSTLLDSHHVLPSLKFIALPWSIFEIAQPMQWLVNTTQENRMIHSEVNSTNYGAWWSFLLMAQVTYAIVPRLLTALVALVKFKQLPTFERSVVTPTESANRVIDSPKLSTVLTKRPELKHYNVCCWLSLDEQLLKSLISSFDSPPDATFQVGFHGHDEADALLDNKPQLLLVAAWEPPMGELKDYLEQAKGVVMLVDHKDGVCQPISDHYIDEWRRFCATLNHWSLFVDKDLA